MKQKIKSLFEQFLLKFSASYIEYRKQNYPRAWTVNSLFYAEDFNHQHIKLLFKEIIYTNFAPAFEHEGSIYIVNDKALAFSLALRRTLALALAFAHSTLAHWHKSNYLFKLSISDFEAALSSARDYEEFLLMCERLNSIDERLKKLSFYGSLKKLLNEAKQ